MKRADARVAQQNGSPVMVSTAPSTTPLLAVTAISSISARLTSSPGPSGYASRTNSLPHPRAIFLISSIFFRESSLVAIFHPSLDFGQPNQPQSDAEA